MTTIPERVLPHAEQVRRLAHRLVGDPDLADDLAQDAVLTGLSRLPSGIADVGRWLGRVLRNRIAEDRRRRARQASRECAAARAEALPSSADLVARLHAHQAVVDAVAALEEPYRSTVLLRWFEELPPRAIAARQGVPVSTVHTRLQRAYARLRRTLDSGRGGRNAWAAAALALGAPTGAVVMKKTLLAIAALAAMGLVWVVARPAPSGAAHGATPAPNAQLASPPAGLPRPGAAAGGGVRTAITGDAPARPEPATEDGPRLRGRVVDAHGLGLAGVPVRFAEDPERTVRDRSTDGGRFAVPITEGRRAVVAEDEHCTTVLAAMVGAGGPADGREPVVVTAPRVSVAGTVVDELGRALPAVRVVRVLPDDFRSRFAHVLDFSREVRREASTDAGGRFVLDPVEAVEGALLRAHHDGYVPETLPVPAGDAGELRFVLRRATQVDGALSGIVFDHRGRPAEGAHVALGRAGTTTAEDGRFALPLEDAGPARTLRAMLRGHRPAERRLDAELPAFVTLELGPPPLRITGRVLDHRGEPLAGARVFARDPEPFGVLSGGAASVEGFLGGGATSEELRARLQAGEAPEVVFGETPSAAWGWVATDADGRFELGGLLERDYELAILLPGSLATCTAGPFAAGAHDVTIRLREPALHPLVAGRVVSRRGEPIPGVTVRVWSDPVRLSWEAGGAATSHAVGRATTTDAEGRFALRDVAAEHAYLRFDSDGTVPRDYGRGVAGGLAAVAGQRPDALEIVVPLRVHLRVELLDPTSADRLSVEDAAGEAQPIDVFFGEGRRTTDVVPLHAGRSETLAVTDAVTTVVLLLGEDVRREVPVDLDPGRLNELRL